MMWTIMMRNWGYRGVKQPPVFGFSAWMLPVLVPFLLNFYTSFPWHVSVVSSEILGQSVALSHGSTSAHISKVISER